MCEDKAELILVAPLFPSMVPTDTTTEKWTKFCAPQNRQNTISTMHLKEAQANYHDVGDIRIVQEHLTIKKLVQYYCRQLQTVLATSSNKTVWVLSKKMGAICHEQNILAKLHDEGFSYRKTSCMNMN